MDKTMNQCILCSQSSLLKNSHIIPKFAIQYLKDTSIGIRNTKKPNVRIQDGAKTYMLCESCEQLFSTYEKYFSEDIFIPFLNNEKNTFDYNEKLFYFMTSISWRILYYELLNSEECYKDLTKEQIKFYKNTEMVLREFLLGKTTDIENIQHHICFFSSYNNLSWDNKACLKNNDLTSNLVTCVYWSNNFILSSIK